VDVEEAVRSLILIRTEAGKEIFHRAREQGYVTAEPAASEIIYRSQKNLLGKRQAIWGRLLAMRLLGIQRPKLEGFHLFKNWLDLPFVEKAKSILGTARRIIQRNYFRPVEYQYIKGAWRTVQAEGRKQKMDEASYELCHTIHDRPQAFLNSRRPAWVF
jgi:coenzyme F420 hydrogenase subunit beta